MGEECNKHQECMERIHTSINAIENSNSRTEGVMEGFTKSVNEFLSAIRKDIYSPGGIVEKVGNHSFQLVLQWGIIGAVIIAVLIGYFKQ